MRDGVSDLRPTNEVIRPAASSGAGASRGGLSAGGLIVALLILAAGVVGWNHVHSNEFREKCLMHNAASLMGEEDPVGLVDRVLCDLGIPEW